MNAARAILTLTLTAPQKVNTDSLVSEPSKNYCHRKINRFIVQFTSN